ncbi:MAG TPA: hypothetical protein VFM44_10185 [Gemmatimonadota bacterium]|nr:hypothetical protein [Gemmatimonadota bacterium]
MSEHPSLERILDHALGRSGASRELEAHMAGCTRCRDARAWATELATAVAEGPPLSAPDGLVDRAISIAREEPRRQAERRWSIARLVEGAFSRPLLAGVRGGATARRMLYEIPGGHVDLEIGPDADDGERWRILAQVMFDDGESAADLAAILWDGRVPVARAAGDETGSFVFGGVPPGEYRLDILSLSSGRAILVGGVRMETGEE